MTQKILSVQSANFPSHKFPDFLLQFSNVLTFPYFRLEKKTHFAEVFLQCWRKPFPHPDSHCEVRVQLLAALLLPLHFRRPLPPASVSVRYDSFYETNASLLATPLFSFVCKNTIPHQNFIHIGKRALCFS